MDDEHVQVSGGGLFVRLDRDCSRLLCRTDNEVSLQGTLPGEKFGFLPMNAMPYGEA